MNIFRKISKKWKKTNTEEDQRTLSEIISATKENEFVASKKSALTEKIVHRVNDDIYKGSTFPCSSPEYRCDHKRPCMPLFEQNQAYIKVAYDSTNKATHACVALVRMEQNKKKGIAPPKMPNCLVSCAVNIELKSSNNNLTAAQDNDLPEQIGKMGLLQRVDNYNKLRAEEREWFNKVLSELSEEDANIFRELSLYLIADNFQLSLKLFITQKKPINTERCAYITEAFDSLAKGFVPDCESIPVVRVARYVDTNVPMKNEEIFRVIVELFFCLGYSGDIPGYTSSFIDK